MALDADRCHSDRRRVSWVAAFPVSEGVRTATARNKTATDLAKVLVCRRVVAVASYEPYLRAPIRLNAQVGGGALGVQKLTRPPSLALPYDTERRKGNANRAALVNQTPQRRVARVVVQSAARSR